MAALAILNPVARRKRKAGAKKHRRKMTPKQLKFFGPRKGKKRKAAKRKKARAKSKVIIVQSNPTRTAMANKKRHQRRRKAKVFTHKSSKRRFRRNPRSIEAGFVNNTMLPAAIGAAGAIGADILISYLPVPPQFKVGGFGIALKIGAALAVGAAVGAVSTRAAGEEAAAGGVIVTLYQISRGFLANAGTPGLSRYVPMNGMRRYVPMSGFAPGQLNRGAGSFAPGMGQRGLGYMSPARIGAPPPSRANIRFLATR